MLRKLRRGRAREQRRRRPPDARAISKEAARKRDTKVRVAAEFRRLRAQRVRTRPWRVRETLR